MFECSRIAAFYVDPCRDFSGSISHHHNVVASSTAAGHSRGHRRSHSPIWGPKITPRSPLRVFVGLFEGSGWPIVLLRPSPNWMRSTLMQDNGLYSKLHPPELPHGNIQKSVRAISRHIPTHRPGVKTGFSWGPSPLIGGPSRLGNEWHQRTFLAPKNHHGPAQ